MTVTTIAAALVTDTQSECECAAVVTARMAETRSDRSSSRRIRPARVDALLAAAVETVSLGAGARLRTAVRRTICFPGAARALRAGGRPTHRCGTRVQINGARARSSRGTLGA